VKNTTSALTRTAHIKLYGSLLLAMIALPTAALATNGYIPHGFGTASKGMAGAGSALPQDVMSAYANPAGLARLDTRLDLALEFFLPNREYHANNDKKPFPLDPIPFSIPPGTQQSDNGLFLIPSFGMNWKLDDKSALGFTVVGHGGMNTDFDTKTFRNFNILGLFPARSPTGVDLKQVVVGLTYARQLTPRQAVGITPLFAGQGIVVHGLQPFGVQGPRGRGLFSESPDNVTNNGRDYAFGGGFRIGWLGTLHERLDAGVSFQSKLWMTKFHRYKGLFAEQGGFDVPPILNAGLAFKISPKLTLVGDYERVFYSDIESLNNQNDVPIRQILTDPNKRLGASGGGLGFGWEDVNVYKIGLQYTLNDSWVLRGGFSHGDKPWSGANTLFNVLAPATTTDHASLGFTYAINKHSDIVFAYTHAFQSKIKGTSQFTGSQTGYVQMYQDDVEVSWAYKF